MKNNLFRLAFLVITIILTGCATFSRETQGLGFSETTQSFRSPVYQSDHTVTRSNPLVLQRGQQELVTRCIQQHMMANGYDRQFSASSCYGMLMFNLPPSATNPMMNPMMMFMNGLGGMGFPYQTGMPFFPSRGSMYGVGYKPDGLNNKHLKRNTHH